jgi:hypothetical protein
MLEWRLFQLLCLVSFPCSCGTPFSPTALRTGRTSDVITKTTPPGAFDQIQQGSASVWIAVGLERVERGATNERPRSPLDANPSAPIAVAAPACCLPSRSWQRFHTHDRPPAVVAAASSCAKLPSEWPSLASATALHQNRGNYSMPMIAFLLLLQSPRLLLCKTLL